MDTNSEQDLEGSISLRALETSSGFRLFFDDDDESYFDLNLEKTADSEDQFEFQIYFSPLHAAAGFSSVPYPADELFPNGRILPLQSFQEVETQGLVVSNYGETQVHPAEILLPERSTPVEDATGRGSVKAQVEPSGKKVLRFDGDRQWMDEKQHQGFAGTRKASNMAAKINNGMIRSLIKFPSEKIQSAFHSIIRSSHNLFINHPKRGHCEAKTKESGHVYKRLVTQFSRWLALGKKSRNESSSKNGDASLQRPSDVDIDEDIIRGILEAVDFSVGSPSWGVASRKIPRGHSSVSPGSAQRELEGAVRNSSINSAIAHCKMSFGSTAAGFTIRDV